MVNFKRQIPKFKQMANYNLENRTLRLVDVKNNLELEKERERLLDESIQLLKILSSIILNVN